MMLFAVYVLPLLFDMITAHNVYMLMFPKEIRPGMHFDCHVTRESKYPRLSMTASITASGNPVVSGDFELSEKNQVISLQIPDDITTSSYRFEVKATDRFGLLHISNTTYLQFDAKRLSVLIQTDKAIYKPGQSVQFRVFAINSELDVLKNTMNIDIFDPSRNRISQWRDVTAESGVFQGEMVMSDQPPLGDWTIEVLYDGKDKMTKRFTVEEFVLPKFEVSLSTPGFGVMNDQYLTGSVSVKYTFGKAVEGNGTLVIKKKYLGYKEKEKKYILDFKIDGNYKVQIEREELFQVLDIKHPTILVLDVNVTETLTGNTQSADDELVYYSRREKISFLTGANTFKPGLRYRTYVFLSDQRDRPLAIDNAVINFSTKLTSASNTNEYVNKTVAVGKNGLARYSLRVPLGISSITVTANYGGVSPAKYATQFHSPTDTYVQVELRTQNLKAGRDARFVIRSTRPKKTIKYMVFSRGGIWHFGEIYMEKRKTFISVPLTPDMAPSSRILVYFIKNNAEIVADSVKFNVEGIFENKVKLRFGRKTTKPGKEVSLVVKADPGSQCNVLAVDKSILLLKKGNDITPGMIEDELLTYDTVYHDSCDSQPCLEQYYSVPIPGIDVSSLFTQAGLYVMTNGLLYKYTPPRRTTSTFYYDYFFSSMTMMMSTMAMTSTRMPTSSLPVASTNLEMEDEVQDAEEKQPTAPPPKVRSLFPDTWIYSNSATANSDGKCLIRATVPDTITTWVATAFAVHNTTGLGVAPKPANLGVFLKFFVRLELPYSVTRGEQLILQASVFNFFTKDLKVNIRLKKSECFENILVSQSANGTSILSYTQEDQYRDLTIEVDGAATLSFPIRPIELGNCDIEIQATSPRASDAVKRELLIKAEGIEENYNIAFLIEVDEDNDFYTEQPVTLPNDLVPGSARIRIAVVGDLMGPSITGLTRLLKMPYGCGEQNMITFVPNIFVINYLEAIDNLKPKDIENGKRFMTAGYQRELTYQHHDGSFSAFGKSDPSGSTWLTAFVLKSFAQAKPYIPIDSNIMQKIINWILRQYDKKRGVFKEPGRVIHKDMQGSSASGENTMAAYTVISLLEAQKAGFGTEVGGFLSLVVDDAIESMAARVDNTSNIFELAIMSYAFALAGSDKVYDVLDILDGSAIQADGMKYWEAQEEPNYSNLFWRPPSSQARPRNIETNAYILLTYVVQEDMSNSLRVMKWLVKQRNSFGGYGSTQDTVLGLQALADVAALVFSPSFDVRIDVTADPEGFNHVFYVNADNSLLFQTVYVPQSTTLVRIQASGQGVSLLQISVTYNVMEDPVEPLFSLTTSFTDETIDGFRLQACFSYLGDDISGMAVMEIGMLSGFQADRFSVTSLGILKRVEEGDNMLVLYFDEITPDMECVEIQMERTGLVVGSQPAVIKLYDYYDPKNHVISLYQPEILRDSDVCSIGISEIGC